MPWRVSLTLQSTMFNVCMFCYVSLLMSFSQVLFRLLASASVSICSDPIGRNTGYTIFDIAYNFVVVLSVP